MGLPLRTYVKRYTTTENKNGALPRIIVLTGTDTCELHLAQGLRSLSVSPRINLVIPPYRETDAIAFGHHDAGR
jgi:hypothetical protein